VKKNQFILLLILILSFSFFNCEGQVSYSSWEETRISGQGKLAVYFRDTKPFIIINENGTLEGLEYEIIQGFKYFVHNRYGVELEMNWSRKENFKSVYGYIRDRAGKGEIAISIVSKTPEREKEVGFSQAYFPDIQILISNHNIRSVGSVEAFVNQFDKYTAITVAGTTYENYLKDIKIKYDLDFPIEFVPSSNEILPEIMKNPKSFGYVDLPNYLIALQNNKLVNRQNIAPIIGFGYCVIFPKDSDWDEPLNAYFSSNAFYFLVQRSTEKYLGKDLKILIDELSQNEGDEILLLKKEKEVSDQALVQKQLEVKQQTWIRNLLIAGMGLLVFLAYTLYTRNKVKSKANEILTIHREMIENQNSELTKRNNELVSLNEDKNNFIRILSHDLRAPVNNVIGLSQVIKFENNGLPKEQIKLLDHITSESERLNRMIERILNVEKIESNKQEQFIKINVSEILNSSARNFENRAGAKNIAIKYDIDENLLVMGIEGYFYHIFDNLISNAIKFSPHGKEVSVILKSKEKVIQANIKDQGPGLSDEDKQKLFRKFQRLSAKPTAGEYTTGIGLSIVHKYVLLSKGYVSCKSEFGHGANFIIKFPKA